MMYKSIKDHVLSPAFPIELLVAIIATLVVAIILKILLQILKKSLRFIFVETWESSYIEEYIRYEERIEIFRIGKYLFGSAVLRYNDLSYKYRIIGRIIGDILTCYYYAVNHNNSEKGTFCIRYYHSSGEFNGVYMFLGKPDDRIVTVAYKWRRSN